MVNIYKPLINVFSFILFFLLSYHVGAQTMLSHKVTINVRQRPIEEILNQIGKQGGFYFSYNSDFHKSDTLVSVKATNKTVRQVLDMMFGDAFQYKEVDNHIVIQRTEKEKNYIISGFIVDRTTGLGLKDASIFESKELVSTLTNDQGHFRIKLKTKQGHDNVIITVSKNFYRDTIILIRSGYDQELNAALIPEVYPLSEIEINQYAQVEHSWFGNFFLSSRQRIQSINLNRFFVNRPYQFSFTPGLGTQGKMSAQVVNKFSFNVLGGYSGGVNGCEIASVFNITKKQARYVQLAGVFNLTGSYVKGVQVAGIANIVSGPLQGVDIAGLTSLVSTDTKGIQVAGIYSHTGKTLKGLQIGGLASHAGNNMKGVQLAGIANVAERNMSGIQMAGLANVAKGNVNGMQVSSLFNKAKQLDGVQIGLVNISDTSSGYSIGLINLVHNGYHRLTVYATEMQNINVDYKSGNYKMYNVLSAGANIGPRKSYMLGYGIGKEFLFSSRLSLTAEVVEQNYYLGTMSDIPVRGAANLDMNVKLTHQVSLFAGPRFCAQFATISTNIPGYRTDVPPNNLKIDRNIIGWLGWTAGISFF